MKLKLLVTALAVTTLFGCASNKVVEKKPEIKTPDQVAQPENKLGIEVPDWFYKPPPATEEYLYVAGSGVSTDLVMSRDKAILNAQDLLADTLNAQVDSVTRHRKVDNAGSISEDYSSKTIRKTVKETFLTGMQIETSRIIRDGNGYRTFVLVRYNIGDANKLLREKQKSQDLNIDQDKKIDQEVKKSASIEQGENHVKTVVLADYSNSVNAEQAKLKAIEVAKKRAQEEGGQVVQLSTTIQ